MSSRFPPKQRTKQLSDQCDHANDWKNFRQYTVGKRKSLSSGGFRGRRERPSKPPLPPSCLDQTDQIETAPPPPHLPQGLNERAPPPLICRSGSATVKFCERPNFIGPKFLRGQIARLHLLNEHIPCISLFSSARIHHTTPLTVHVFSTSAKTL